MSKRQLRILLVLGLTMGGNVFLSCLGLAAFFEWPNYKTGGLRSAIVQNDASRIDAVLNEKPDLIEVPDKVGQTPLIQAVWNNKRIAVETLIRRGANIKARWAGSRDWNTAYHWNALHCTGETGNVEIAEVLLKAGVDINEKSENGQTPLDVAIERGKSDVEAFLRANGGKRGSELP